jgi:hypothetical protein
MTRKVNVKREEYSYVGWHHLGANSSVDMEVGPRSRMTILPYDARLGYVSFLSHLSSHHSNANQSGQAQQTAQHEESSGNVNSAQSAMWVVLENCREFIATDQTVIGLRGTDRQIVRWSRCWAQTDNQ